MNQPTIPDEPAAPQWSPPPANQISEAVPAPQWSPPPANQSREASPAPEWSAWRIAQLPGSEGSGTPTSPGGTGPTPPATATARSPMGRGALMALLLATALGGGAIGGAAAAFLLNDGPGFESVPLTSNVVAELTSASPLGAASGDYIVDVVRATRPAVVTVLNLRAVREGRDAPIKLMPLASGSGVIFDPRGYVATNAHVVEGNQGIEVVFVDGRRAEAQLVNSDANYDIAILKVTGELPAVAALADSSRLEPGMRVLAIGSPLGTEFQNTVTTGIVAGLNRIVTVQGSRFDRRTFQFVREETQLNAAPMIQTDAAINSGNSGGPLINIAGEVVGLNTLVKRDTSGAGGFEDGAAGVEGMGFAVPSNVVHALADEWIDGKPRPFLGIDYESITPDVARERNLEHAGGAVVLQIRAGSAAGKAGIKVGDVITEVDGVPLDLDHALTELLWRYRSGDLIKLTVRRANDTSEVEVSLGAFAAAPTASP